ncbi:hypothetical protein MARBORIA2_02150 [Methanobrevibacter arboriphilus]|jgi:preprotein translocase subunit SecF|uniref:hypothetical protein n=1 Tax=Methanobrevibacter arboriphilus TaxID=39441 RepID=UPI0022ED9E67|nr:hypothetical protein [Methanobrevibacter arboriphilus]GLI11125.1 hypothetical protein MARBORIA2_02150 [Methanobrevibacter arboriphilus]
MEKKKKIILGIIIIIIMIASSLAIYIANNENNFIGSQFKKGEKINLKLSTSSMDYSAIENEIKNKVNNNWTDLNNAITNQIQTKLKNESNSYLTMHDEHLKTEIELVKSLGWKVEETVSSSFDEGYETWDYYVFKIRFSELTVNGKVNQNDNGDTYLIIKKDTGECHICLLIM